MSKYKSVKLPDGNYKCVICDKISTTQQSISSHWWRAHTEHGRSHKGGGRRTGSPGWNKGLTKETDVRVRKISASLSETMRNKVADGSYVPITQTEESREKTSVRQSVNNSGGRCKWFSYNGVNLQGTWELNLAKKLDSLGVKWKKVTQSWVYFDDENKKRRYTPDFYLEDYGIFLEIKGYWWGEDRRKMELVIEQHKDKTVIIIEKAMYEGILSAKEFII